MQAPEQQRQPPGRDEQFTVLRQGAPTSGEVCIQFEKDFAAYCGVAHARAVSNGTAALFLSLVALDVKPGDRVLTTPLTWIAKVPAIGSSWPMAQSQAPKQPRWKA